MMNENEPREQGRQDACGTNVKQAFRLFAAHEKQAGRLRYVAAYHTEVHV